MLVVHCQSPHLSQNYEICEAHVGWVDGLEVGTLVWIWAFPDRPAKVRTSMISNVGNKQYTPVTPEEAMILTGMQHPMAALDKLRDLVHES